MSLVIYPKNPKDLELDSRITGSLNPDRDELVNPFCKLSTIKINDGPLDHTLVEVPTAAQGLVVTSPRLGFR